MDGLTHALGSVPQGVQWALAGVGALYLGRKVLSYLHLALNLFILSGTNLSKYGKKGSWAVVTGASDGLGKEFASQLAAKGFNIVLVSRTESKLVTLAQELEAKFGGKGLQTKVFAMDYSKDQDEDYARLGQALAGLDVAILINNVGQSHSIPVPFLETPREELQGIVTINCLGTLKTTQTVAPIMVKRGGGLILTMGSFGGWMPTPFLATYSGSKAFLQQWSSSLAEELRASKVDVHLVLGYLIVGAMSKVRRPSLLIPNMKPFVWCALNKVGCGSQRMAYTYTPWWSHAIFQWVVENTVGTGSRIGIWYNLKMHVDIRNRALRKAAREAKKA